MNGFDVVQEETLRLARGCCILAVIAYAVCAFAGYYHWNIALSLALGTAYAVFHFNLMARGAVQSVLLGDAALARRRQKRQYLTRYLLTALLLGSAAYLPMLSITATALPLLFPKLVFTASRLFPKKGD